METILKILNSMERKNDISPNDILSVSQRQHITGLLIILFKQYRAALSTLVPLLFVFFTAGDAPKYAYMAIVLLLLLYTVFAVLKYLNIKFQLKDGEFICVSGVFDKKKLTIPFDKIMNIDYEQNIVQQVLNVGKLKVETAGSSKEEVELYALTLDKIKAIRNIIFEHKSLSDNVGTESINNETTELTSNLNTRELIYQLSSYNLLKSGITANHLETAVLILALIFSFGQRLREWKLLGEYEDYEESIYNFMSTLKLVGIVIIVFFFISIITSMIRQVIIYFELRFYRTPDGFYISKGLFNKNLIAVKDEKIQSVLIRQNLLRNLVGMFDFGLQKIGDSRQMINVPGMNSDNVSKTIDILYPSFLQRKFVFYPISRFYFKRLLFIVLTGTALLIIIGLIMGSYFLLVVILVASAFLISSFYLKSKKLQFAVDENFVVIMGGKFGTKKKIIPLEKIQTVGYSDSPYQRRKKLKTLHISDGGGTSTVPFIDEVLCVQIREYLIFIMERSRRTSIHFNNEDNHE